VLWYFREATSPVSDNSLKFFRRFSRSAESSTAFLSFVSVWLKAVRSCVFVRWDLLWQEAGENSQYNMRFDSLEAISLLLEVF